MTVLTIRWAGREYRINDPGGRIGNRLAVGRPYEHQLCERIRLRKLSGTALDIGAHVGNHTLFFSIVCGLNVHAFEANLETHSQLRRNLELNSVKNVRTYPYAVGETFGAATWRRDVPMSLDTGQPGVVPVRAIDEMLSIDDLVLVKIDVEGMEPQALAGMREHLRRCRPVIYTEVHSRQAHQAQADVLRPLGYRMTGSVQMGSRMECWESPK